jgi:hypothetical protein
MPTQQQIYARRRGLAILGILVVVTIIWFTTANPFGQQPQTVTAPEVSESSSASAAPAEVVECAPGVVVVEAMIGSETETLNTFGSGALPMLWYGITNTGLEDCKFNVGARVTFYTITSGDQTYWSSRDCDRSQDTDAYVTLPANKMIEAPKGVWDRVFSSELGCSAADGNDPVPSGGATYRIKAEVNGVISDDKSFILN